MGKSWVAIIQVVWYPRGRALQIDICNSIAASDTDPETSISTLQLNNTIAGFKEVVNPRTKDRYLEESCPAIKLAEASWTEATIGSRLRAVHVHETPSLVGLPFTEKTSRIDSGTQRLLDRGHR
jgi:hypothetical protein